MAEIKFKGNTVNTYGNLPEEGTVAPDFKLVNTDLETISRSNFKNKRLILNIFPSIDTQVCATSVKNFNEKANEMDNTEVLCISRDLPFAQKRFEKAENIENITHLSDFKKSSFAKDYGLEMVDGPLEGLLSRVVIVVDEEGRILHSQQVADIAEEPDYLSALKSLL